MPFPTRIGSCVLGFLDSRHPTGRNTHRQRNSTKTSPLRFYASKLDYHFVSFLRLAVFVFHFFVAAHSLFVRCNVTRKSTESATKSSQRCVFIEFSLPLLTSYRPPRSSSPPRSDATQPPTSRAARWTFWSTSWCRWSKTCEDSRWRRQTLLNSVPTLSSPRLPLPRLV